MYGYEIVLIVILLIGNSHKYNGGCAGTKKEGRSEACMAKLNVVVCTIKTRFFALL